MSRIAVRLRINGHVQGVGYRMWACAQARSQGLDGWVRNRADGSVELFAAGAPNAVDELVAACRQGPSGARVTDIERSGTTDEALRGFDLRPSF